MALQLVAFNASQAANATEVDLPAVLDPSMVRNANNHFLLGKPYNLVCAYAQGATIGRARINMPGLRGIFIPYIWPLQLTANPPNNPNYHDLREYPIPLKLNDELEVDTTNTAGVADIETVCLWLSTGVMPAPVGRPIMTIRATAAITAVAFTWSFGVLTLGQNLPPGNYMVTNFQCQSATIIAARLIFQGQQERPGVIGSTAIGNNNGFQGRHAPFGIMGQFVNTALPQLEILCSAADAAQIVHLDLIPLQ